MVTDPWDSFRTTWVRVDLPGETVEVHPASAGNRGRLPEPLRHGVHVVTASNPQGRRATDDDNRAAGLRLSAEVAAQGLRCWPCTGIGADGTWSEEGLAIAGLTRHDAVDLARRYDQAAIFEITDTDGGFRLIRCADGDVEERGWEIRPAPPAPERAPEHEVPR